MGTTYGTKLCRLANGLVERQQWVNDGFGPRTYLWEKVEIESLQFQLVFFNEDYLIQPDRPQHGSYMVRGLTFVCDVKRHLVCWPYSKENLHLMAQHLDLKRHWFHSHHYDIPQRRILELVNRCSLAMSPRMIVKIIRGSIGDIAPDVATSWQTLVANLNAPAATTS